MISMRLQCSYLAGVTATMQSAWSYARAAAASGLGAVFRAGRGQFSAGLGNHTNGLLRIPGIGSRP